MKKLLSLAILMLLFSAATAYSQCTPEEFQSLVAQVQASLQEISKKDASKLEALNADMEKLFSGDIKELEAMSKETMASQDPAKAQIFLDKSCDLYKRINATIDGYK